MPDNKIFVMKIEQILLLLSTFDAVRSYTIFIYLTSQIFVEVFHRRTPIYKPSTTAQNSLTTFLDPLNFTMTLTKIFIFLLLIVSPLVYQATELTQISYHLWCRQLIEHRWASVESVWISEVNIHSYLWDQWSVRINIHGNISQHLVWNKRTISLNARSVRETVILQ